MNTTLEKDIVHFLKQLGHRQAIDPPDKIAGQAEWLVKQYEKAAKAECREDTLRIEVDFPRKVFVADRTFQRLVDCVSEICKDYEKMHPGRVMWPAGIGSKITYMPMTKEEEDAGRHIEFQDDTLHVEVCERMDYDWPCKKCGKLQDDHYHFAIVPEAGTCEFEPTDTKPKPRREEEL